MLALEQWICCSYRFDLRRAVFIISARDLFVAETIVTLHTKDPSEIRACLERALLKEHPSLQGAVISFLGYDVSRAVWEMSVFHNSLPETPDGEKAPEIPFRKEVWAKEF